MLRTLAILAVISTASVQSRAEPVQVRLSSADDGFRVEGSFDVADPTGEITWQVLTDYDDLGKLVPGMRQSRVEHRGSSDVIVVQDATAKVLFVSREVHLLLDVRETPRSHIAFRDLSHRDFTVYRGAWTLVVSNGNTHVGYQLLLMPREHVPGFIAGGAVSASVRAELEHLRAEIDRRCAAKSQTRK
jgi:hypothetical protein